MIIKFKLFENHEDVDPYNEEDWGESITNIKCPSCGEYTGVEGICPYEEEFGKTTKCNCCPVCKKNCALDI